MSAHNLGTQLEETTVKTADTSGRIFVWDAGTPSNGVSGFAKGAIYVNTSGSTSTTRIYVNSGTNESATWTAVVCSA